VQFGAVPVFLDVTIPEYNIDVSQLEKALTSKTKAVMIAHTMGNPFNLGHVIAFCQRHNLWLIEDACDALGSEFSLGTEFHSKKVGSFGDISTFSFYPAHHITTGEGGSVCTSDSRLHKLILSLRDWGRDCTCAPGQDNACKKRFSREYEDLPYGYDHKYVYSRFGYNLKVTEFQAAIGCAQLEKAEGFISKRRANWRFYKNSISGKHFILPESQINSSPSWFGFVLSLKPDVPFKREALTKYMESEGIQTRVLFAGNILRHPCMKGVEHRIIGELKNSDYILKNTFWIGVYPGLTEEQKEHVITTISKVLD
jgi:CDP-6-deoxy-D-xylo-4-hexulose-3-dehydrase